MSSLQDIRIIARALLKNLNIVLLYIYIYIYIKYLQVNCKINGSDRVLEVSWKFPAKKILARTACRRPIRVKFAEI